MGCLSRLILWIIRAVAIIALLLCILGAIFMPSERVKFIIGGVVALAIGSATARKTDKIKSNYNGKCSKCGASLANAGFRYRSNLSTAKINAGGVYLTVDIFPQCPNCGCEKIIVETLDFPNTDSVTDENIQSEIRRLLSGG